MASGFGTGSGGMVHLLVGRPGGVIVLASAERFTALKRIGAVSLLRLGFRTVLAARREAATVSSGAIAAAAVEPRRAF